MSAHVTLFHQFICHMCRDGFYLMNEEIHQLHFLDIDVSHGRMVSAGIPESNPLVERLDLPDLYHNRWSCHYTVPKNLTMPKLSKHPFLVEVSEKNLWWFGQTSTSKELETLIYFRQVEA